MKLGKRKEIMRGDHMIRRTLLSAVLLSFVAGTMLVSAGTSAAAAPAGGQHCLLPEAGERLECASSAAGIEQASAQAVTALVTVYVARNLNPDLGYITFYDNPCSGPTNDLDYVDGLAPFNEQISSVRKYTNGHCNWQLEGPAGNRSTWVEGNWTNLSNLGNGWEDRAVKIRLT